MDEDEALVAVVPPVLEELLVGEEVELVGAEVFVEAPVAPLGEVSELAEPVEGVCELVEGLLAELLDPLEEGLAEPLAEVSAGWLEVALPEGDVVFGEVPALAPVAAEPEVGAVVVEDPPEVLELVLEALVLGPAEPVAAGELLPLGELVAVVPELASPELSAGEVPPPG